MTQIEIFLKELTEEAITTRKMLALVQTEKFDWQPHPKSMTIYSLATHIADIPSWVSHSILLDEMDFGKPEFQTPVLKSTDEILAFFEKNLEKAIADLKVADESTFGEMWSLKYMGDTIGTWSKAEVIRHSISQTIHHRAQLGVFLRLLDIPIPGSYGPSADEMGG